MTFSRKSTCSSRFDTAGTTLLPLSFNRLRRQSSARVYKRPTEAARTSASPQYVRLSSHMHHFRGWLPVFSKSASSCSTRPCPRLPRASCPVRPKRLQASMSSWNSSLGRKPSMVTYFSLASAVVMSAMACGCCHHHREPTLLSPSGGTKAVRSAANGAVYCCWMRWAHSGLAGTTFLLYLSSYSNTFGCLSHSEMNRPLASTAETPPRRHNGTQGMPGCRAKTAFKASWS
mmetsp:Transcript_20937/g.66042  ORF Transcript_20937/g.66042 Transcript_20937/m.66042 type:complete len:231 (-) Transcript_20937:727-1419(-)